MIFYTYKNNKIDIDKKLLSVKISSVINLRNKMTAEESENFIKGIIKDIKENNVTYVGDNIRNKIKI